MGSVGVAQISSQDRGEWSASYPAALLLGERAPSTHWIGSYVGPSVRQDAHLSSMEGQLYA
jgi:hypothetical protein